MNTEKLPSVSYHPAPALLLNAASTDPYPFAVDEVFDAYRIIVESKGKAIGIGIAGGDLNVVLSGDSACVRMFSAGEHLLTLT